MFAELIAAASKPQAVKEAKPSKAQDKEVSELSEDFPTILTSVLALVFSALAVPEDVRPNQSELGAVSYHATRIMLRHIDVTNKLNADALDIIGILSTSAAWYMRISPAFKPAQFFGAKSETVSEPVKQEEKATDPGARLNDDSTAAFLSRSAALAAERQN